MNKVLIVGSGISGLSIANLLKDSHQVEVIEKENRFGGLIKCEKIDGNLFHKVGGHVFNSRNPEVLDWFWSHFDKNKEFIPSKRNAKIFIQQLLVGYPIENYLYQFPEHQVKNIINEILDKISENKNEEIPQNFKEFLIQNFGSELYQLYFEPYNHKIWNTDLSLIPLPWLEGKLPMPNMRETIISNILKKEEANMVHSSFFYPLHNGSQFIVDRLAENINISCSYALEKIELAENGNISINNGEKVCNALIYCGDIRNLCNIIKIENKTLQKALEKVSDLSANGTSNVLCETDETDLSWLYLPENKLKAHRIIYTGNFSENNNAKNKRKTCVVEFSGKQDKETMLKELSQLPGNLKALAFNYEANSYVIQNHATRNDIQHLKKELLHYNIHLLGRFAEWEYYNMDKCVEAAMTLKQKYFENA